MTLTDPFIRRTVASKTRSHRSRSRRHRDNEAEEVSEHTQTERPSTLDDLRKARINFLEQKPSNQLGKMKYEYTKRIPRSVSVVETEPKLPSPQSKEETKRGTRRKRRRRTSERPGEKNNKDRKSIDDFDEYVYRSSPIEARETSAQTDTGVNNATKEPSAQRKVEKRTTIRRHHTSPTVVSTPAPTASSLVKEPALSETASIRPSNNRRGSSILGSLFTARNNHPPPPIAKVSCLTCGDDVSKPKTAKLPCSHRMCHSCLKRLFKLSITDPAHMPPKCCTDEEIDLKHVDKLFDQDFKTTWNRKFKEFKAKNRIYCPKKGCGQWIQPKHMETDKGRKVGKCPACKMFVCGFCSQKMHKSRDCPKDPATTEFIEVAKKSGWQKCYNCSAMVELKEGCNHMTCRCTAEFCMACGKKWKSCDCPWFSYAQIDASGDPIRYQQEMDRRREQVQRDEEIARRMEAMGIDQAMHNMFRVGNTTRHQVNQNFIQQAREALTANYNVADQAARGLLNGLFQGRENRPDLPQPYIEQEQQARQRVSRRGQNGNDPAEESTVMPATDPVPRHRVPQRRQTLQNGFEDRPQTDAERDQERRIRMWADNAPAAT